MDGVGVEQPTYAIIFYEYVWEFEKEYSVKDDLLLSVATLLYPNIFHNSCISIPYCENSFSYFSTYDHSQNTWYVTLYLIAERTNLSS